MIKSPTRRADAGAPDYRLLAEFRYDLRCFLRFSEEAAGKAGLTPQRYQALLSIKGSPGEAQTIGELADRLLIAPHSASGLVQRLVGEKLLSRSADPEDARRVLLRLTPSAEEKIELLARAHRIELRKMEPLLRGLLEGLIGAEEPTSDK